AIWASAGVAATVAALAMCLSSAPQLVRFTAVRVARVARVATLASTSFSTGVPHELPLAFAGRTEIVTMENPVAIANPAPVALSEPTAVTVDGTSPSAIAQESVSHVIVPSSESVFAEHLGSRSIPFLVRIPELESTASSQVEADGVDWAALGRR